MGTGPAVQLPHRGSPPTYDIARYIDRQALLSSRDDEVGARSVQVDQGDQLERNDDEDDCKKQPFPGRCGFWRERQWDQTAIGQCSTKATTRNAFSAPNALASTDSARGRSEHSEASATKMGNSTTAYRISDAECTLDQTSRNDAAQKTNSSILRIRSSNSAAQKWSKLPHAQKRSIELPVR